MSVGKVHPKSTMFFCMEAGSAKEGKNSYALTVGAVGHAPIVRNETTGKVWTISWEELIRLAQEAGIDK